MENNIPIPHIKPAKEKSHANKGNKEITPMPKKIIPKHPAGDPSFALLTIKYPMGIAMMAMIKPIKTSSPSGKPISGYSKGLLNNRSFS